MKGRSAKSGDRSRRGARCGQVSPLDEGSLWEERRPAGCCMSASSVWHLYEGPPSEERRRRQRDAARTAIRHPSMKVRSVKAATVPHVIVDVTFTQPR
jgi:hypothetical protein